MSREDQIQLACQWQQTQDREIGEQLWQIILSRIKERLWSIAVTFGLKEDFEDILQDTFIDFSKKVLSGDFRPEGNASPSTFVAKITVNKMCSEVNKRARQSKALKNKPKVRPEDYEVDTAEQVIKQDIVSFCIKIVEEFQEPMKTVFCLRVGIFICQDNVINGIKMNNTKIGQLYGKSRGWASEQYTEAVNIIIKQLFDKIGGSNF